MRLLLLGAVFLSACAPRFNWPEFRMTQGATTDSVGKVNAEVLDSIDTLVYDVRGDRISATMTRYRRMKVYTPEGVRAGEVHLPFSARMKLAEFDGRNFKPEGNAYTMTKARLDEVTVKRPLADVGVKEYGELIMNIPGVAPGSIIDYFAVYEIPDALLIEPILMRNRLPSERAELLVIAPKDADFELRFLENGVTKPNAPLPANPPSDNQAAYRFVLKDLPALIPEEMMPSPARIGPAIWPVYRGMKGKEKGPKNERWEDVLKWVKQNYRLTSASGSQTDPEKLQAAFAVEAIRIPVADTFLRVGERPFGVGEDRMTAGLKLYDAMAARGYKVGLGLVTRESAGLVLPEVPSPALFDAIVVSVPISGKTVYLDPSCPTCPLDQVSQALEGAQVVAIYEDNAKIDTLPTRDPKDNGFSVTLSLKLGIKGDVIGAGQAVMSGAPAAMVRAAYSKKDKTAFARELSLLPTAKISNLASPDSNQAALTFETSFDISSQCKEEQPAKMRCGLDLFVDKLLPEVWREARTQDLLMGSVFQHTLVVTFQIPTKARVEPPQPMVARSKFGEYSLGYQMENGQLSLTRRFVISQRRVPADDYDDFISFLSQARQFDAISPLIEFFAEDAAPPPPPVEEKKPEKQPKKGKKK